MIEIQRKAIDVEAVVDSVRRDDAGALVLFLGSVRSDPGVEALDYEVYRPMALKKMHEIAEAARKKFGVLEVSIVHRLGRIKLGGDSVAIAASAGPGFAASTVCAAGADPIRPARPASDTVPTNARRSSCGMG